MRLIDVVAGCALLGLAIGFLHTTLAGSTHAKAEARGSERITWLWVPAVRRTSAVQ